MDLFQLKRRILAGSRKLLVISMLLCCLGAPAQQAGQDGEDEAGVILLDPNQRPITEEDREVIEEIFSDPLPQAAQPLKPQPLEPPVLSELARGALAEPEVLEDGILRYTTQLPLAPAVWFYLPAQMPRTAQVPMVLISPAGSGGYHGMELSPADEPEHLPYVRAGMIVAAFSTPGSLPDNWTDEERRDAVNNFHASGKGVRTARDVMNYAIRLFPQVDTGMVFSAGHSSAGALALTLGAYHSSLRGIIAYAPSTDLKTELGELTIEIFDSQIPGFAAFTRLSSPLNLVRRISSPVFVFQTEDDRVINSSATTEFVQKLRLSNTRVTYLLVPEGGHYDGMLEKGVPAAISWIDVLTGWRELPENQVAKGKE